MGDFESIFAFSSTYGSKIEVEDSLVATLRFRSGAIGTIEATTAARPSNIEASICVLGSQGSIQVGGFAANKVDYCTLESISDKCLDEELSLDVYGNGHAKMYRDYLQKIKNGEEYEVCGEEALKSIKLINALYKSIEEGREVKRTEDCSSKILGKSIDGWQ